MRVAVTKDQAIMILGSECYAEYDTLTPEKDAKALRERFDVNCVLVDKTLVFNINEKIARSIKDNKLEKSIKDLGFDIKKLRIQ